MQQTFEINAGKINAQLLKTEIAKFGNRDVRIIIQDVETDKPVSQKELFKNMEKLRKKLSTVKVDPNLDLSALANEMLGQ